MVMLMLVSKMMELRRAEAAAFFSAPSLFGIRDHPKQFS